MAKMKMAGTDKPLSSNNNPSATPSGSGGGSYSSGAATMTARPPQSTTAKTPPTHDQIARRAYEIWVAKGRPAGRDIENWKQAERELNVR